MTPEDEGRSISRAVLFGSLLLLGYLAYRIVEPFLGQIGWAVVLAICLAPLQDRLRARMGPTRCAAVLTILVLILLVIPFLFAAVALFGEGANAVSDLQDQLRQKGGAAAWLATAWEWLRTRWPFLPTQEAVIADLSQRAGGAASFVVDRASSLFAGLAVFVFNLAITLGMLFFLLRDGEVFAAGLRSALPFGAARNERLLGLTRDLVSASVTATLTVASIQGVIGGLTLALLGIRSAMVWGVVIAILALLPLVGATLVWLPASVWLILSGSVARGVVLLLVGLLILGNVDNVVRPWLLSGRARMNTLVMLVSLLGGVSAFGFIGIVLGPLVASLVTALAESYQEAPATAETPRSTPTGATTP